MEEKIPSLADLMKMIAEEKEKQKPNHSVETLDLNINEAVDNMFSELTGKPVKEESVIREKSQSSLIEASLGLLGGSAKEKTEDPLTPLDQNFVTHKDLANHYKTFIQRVQHQMSTIGGGGEVRLRNLDDVDRSTIGPNKHLAYNPTTDKFFFEEVAAASELTEDGTTIDITNNIIGVENVPNSVLGPIQGLRFDTTHNHDSETVGTLCWNAADDTLNIRHSGGVVQQIGQEQYAYVRNNTGSTITDGSVVQFAGAEDSDGEARLEVAPFLADGTFPSLYTLGVATQNINDGADGRVTVWGKVRDVNTSGTPVGESWAVGDILFANPNSAGLLTNIKPTAPNNVVPIAAVLLVDSSEGQLFVRPTVEQKMSYGKFARTTDVTIDATDSATPVTLDTDLGSNGIAITNGSLTVDQSGFYQIDINAQVDVGGGFFNQGTVYLWMRVNDSDVPYSTRRQAITSTLAASTMANTFTLSLDANDEIKIMYAGNDTELLLSADSATSFAPATASVLCSVSQIQL